MADIRGLIIPRSYNEYLNKSEPDEIKEAVQSCGALDDYPQIDDTTASDTSVYSSEKTDGKYVDKNISDLTAISSADIATDDLLLLQDVSDNALKKVTASDIIKSGIDDTTASTSKVYSSSKVVGDYQFTGDLNNAPAGLCKIYINSCSNVPYNADYHAAFVETLNYEENYAIQYFYALTKNVTYQRNKVGGNWSVWQKLVTESDLNAYRYVELWSGSLGNGSTLQIDNFTDNANKYRNYVFILYRADMNVTLNFTLPTLFLSITDTNTWFELPRTGGTGYFSVIPRYIQGNGSPIVISDTNYYLTKVYAELN